MAGDIPVLGYAFGNNNKPEMNGLAKNGAGNLILSGTNTYTGAATISGGTLSIGGPASDASVITTTGASAVITQGALNLGSSQNNLAVTSGGLVANAGDGALSLNGQTEAVGDLTPRNTFLAGGTSGRPLTNRRGGALDSVGRVAVPARVTAATPAPAAATDVSVNGGAEITIGGKNAFAPNGYISPSAPVYAKEEPRKAPIAKAIPVPAVAQQLGKDMAGAKIPLPSAEPESRGAGTSAAAPASDQGKNTYARWENQAGISEGKIRDVQELEEKMAEMKVARPNPILPLMPAALPPAPAAPAEPLSSADTPKEAIGASLAATKQKDNQHGKPSTVSRGSDPKVTPKQDRVYRTVDEFFTADRRKGPGSASAGKAQAAAASAQAQELYTEAQGFYDTGRFSSAKKRAEQILNMDPNNVAARQMEEKVDKAMSDYGVASYNEARADAIAKADMGWARPIRRFNAPEPVPAEGAASSPTTEAIRRKLERIIIPKVEFRDATVSEALAFLKKKSAELDADSPAGARGTNIVLKREPRATTGPAPEIPGVPGLQAPAPAAPAAAAAAASPDNPAEPKITVSLTNVPLIEALKYVSGLANMKLKVEPYAVSVVPITENTDVFVTKEYKLPPNLIPRTSTVAAGSAAAAPSGATASAGSPKKGSTAIADREAAKNWLIANGVQFNGNASAILITKSNHLIVRNTEDQIELVDQIVDAATETPPAKPGKAVEKIPDAKPVPGKPGFVYSPYAKDKGYIDVRGFPPGTEVKDPYSGKSFLVPSNPEPKRDTPAPESRTKKPAKAAKPSATPAPTPAATPAPSAALIPQPEIQTHDNAFSTFSLNVSDVAFQLAAASIEQGKLPDPDTLRSEEFINAFDYRDPEPAPGAPLGFTTERARYPFAQNRDLLRFSIKTAAAGRAPGRPLNIVLLLDKSGSMERADRVNIVREALRVLTTQLQPQDKLSIITFARTPRLWADGLAGDKVGEMIARVGEITPEGGTNLEAALDLGYATALRHHTTNGISRVALFTDGAANLGDVDPQALKEKVETHRKQGVALDCFGIGWEGYNDDLLEELTRHSDGRYGFINTPEEAAQHFAAQLAGALHVAASDVKVQVEFNPQRVTAYRQIGYAKHQLTKEQFRDNTVNAAQIGAAEAGTALYVVDVNPKGEGDLATVRVRFRVPGTGDVSEHEWPVPYEGNNVPPLDKASSTLRLAGTAGAFSELLAGSQYAAEVTSDQLLHILSGVPAIYSTDPRPQKLEWMIRQAQSLVGR
jgi:autotransporter-associated beta strand protein